MSPATPGDTLRERMVRIEQMQLEILRRLDYAPTPERCAAEEGRVTALEDDVRDNIRPQIADLYEKHNWMMRACIGSMSAALVSLLIAAGGWAISAWKGCVAK